MVPMPIQNISSLQKVLVEHSAQAKILGFKVKAQMLTIITERTLDPTSEILYV